MLIIPNRAVQKWYMDVTFPELGQEGFIGVKDELTDALKTQFPDIYKPTMELADQTDTAENTIKYVVGASKQLMQDSNALQTLKEYALDRYLFVYPMLATFSSLSCLSVAIGKEPSSLVIAPAI